MNDIIYKIRDLVKIYDTRCVLDLAHLDIYRGEVLALVGPSGAGKSTLLRLLNFLELPTSGHIRFLDTDLDGGRPAPLALRRRVTTVFQRPILLNRSVEANVRYGLRLRGRSDEGRQVRGALEQVRMADLTHQKARTLSGGEMQRVSLARAMV
ncbi:MAG: ATP-binding cassette domain-containing protein, partial [Anaerolineae bacterium]|nr:ATP-binding cassette domain-containing protein [Anaerolineae bacterium]